MDAKMSETADQGARAKNGKGKRSSSSRVKPAANHAAQRNTWKQREVSQGTEIQGSGKAASHLQYQRSDFSDKKCQKSDKKWLFPLGNQRLWV